MKHDKTKQAKPTPEETLRQAAENRMDLHFEYTHIQDRLDVEEIARVGAVRKASRKAAPTPASAPRRSAVAAVLIAAVLLTAPLLAVGSFLIARSTMEPPMVDTDTAATHPDGTSAPTETPDDPGTDAESAPPAIPPMKDGSFSTELYDVTDIDGVCYMSFRPEAMYPEDTEMGPSSQIGAIYFTSMDDMYQSFSTGTLTGHQVRVIQSAFQKTEHGYLIPNIHDLNMPLMPEGCTAGGVCVIEDQYEVGIYSPMASAGMGFYDEGQFRARLKSRYTDYYENDNLYGITLTEGEYDGIPCEIGECKTSAAALRTVRFRVESEGKTLSVLITYCIESFRDDSLLTTSDTIPYDATIFCEQDGQYSVVYLSDFQSHLPIEWLTAFGITDYQEPDILPTNPVSSLSTDKVTGLSDTLFDLNGSYATENALFLRVDHLSAEILGQAPLTMLEVTDYNTWKDLFPGLSADTYEDYSALDAALRRYDTSFFSNYSLLILLTEGRSGSIRYRVDDLKSNSTYVQATLTAGVPHANTMDVVHWCVIIPVEKPLKGETNHLVYLETQDIPMDSFEDFVTLASDTNRGMYFRSGHGDEGSYVQDGYLFGRLRPNLELYYYTYPCTETITSFAGWQERYKGHDNAEIMDQDFLSELAALDESFFSEKALLVVYMREPTGNVCHRIDEIEKQSGGLTVRITPLLPSTGGGDYDSYWAILIPIEKKDVLLPVTVDVAQEYGEYDNSMMWE